MNKICDGLIIVGNLKFVCVISASIRKLDSSPPLCQSTGLRSQARMLLNLVQSNKKANDIHEGKWNGLGSRFEAGETPEECVIREVLEESGLLIQNPMYCGILRFPNFKGNDWYVFVFSASEFTGELIDSPEGKLEWILDEKLLDLNLWESDHIFFQWINEGNLFPQSSNMTGMSCRVITWSSILINLRV